MQARMHKDMCRKRELDNYILTLQTNAGSGSNSVYSRCVVMNGRMQGNTTYNDACHFLRSCEQFCLSMIMNIPSLLGLEASATSPFPTLLIVL